MHNKLFSVLNLWKMLAHKGLTIYMLYKLYRYPVHLYNISKFWPVYDGLIRPVYPVPFVAHFLPAIHYD